jgi:hypothetical protein
LPHKIAPETWAEIRRRVVETDEPIRRIGARFHVAHSTISQRALLEDWPRHPSRVVRVRPAPPAVGAVAETAPKKRRRRSFKRREPAAPEARNRRMLVIMDLQLEQLEKDMASIDTLTPQERERLGREFAVIVANLAKVKEKSAAHEKATASSAGAAAGANLSAAEFRRQIADRLERLNAKWMARKKSGRARRERD